MHLLDALRFEHWNIVEEFSSAIRDWPPEQRLQLFVELAEQESPASRSWLFGHGLQADALTPDSTGIFTKLLERLPATTAALIEWHAAGASAAGGDGVVRLSDALPDAGTHRDSLERLALAMVENGAEIFCR
jgi:hypothetical protein